MNELNSEVKSKLLLGDSIVINIQALQSAVANCATKDDLKNIDLSRYATKEDLENIDISETVGELGNLETEDKSNLVNAINEVNVNLEALNASINGQLAAVATIINDTIDLL
jgi:hypothetical protein